MLHVRLRHGKAASPRGVVRFVDELIARVERAGAGGEKLLRADSAFWNKALMKRLEKADWLYSISIRAQKGVAERIGEIPEWDWQTIEDYSDGGEAGSCATAAGRCRFLPDAHYYFAAASVREGPVGSVVGDLLVRSPSASGRGKGRGRRIPFELDRGLELTGLKHFDLLNHPAVYEQIRAWVSQAPEGACA